MRYFRAARSTPPSGSPPRAALLGACRRGSARFPSPGNPRLSIVTQVGNPKSMAEKPQKKRMLRWLLDAALGIAALEALLWLLKRGTGVL